MKDYLSITETPGELVNPEQYSRMVLRYSLAAQSASGQRVLEVSCGSGIGLGLLEGIACSLAACDYSIAALALAQQTFGDRVRFAGADAQQLPYADNAFDLILSFEAIYYLAHPDSFLHECRRVLAHGGHVLIGTSNPDWPFFVPGALSNHYPTAPELDILLRSSGFHAVRFFGSLPVDQNSSPRRIAVARLRKLLLRSRAFRGDNAVTRRLKRLSYGQLTPLPAALSPTLRSEDARAQLTPIEPKSPDRRHRVLFAIAES